MASSSSRPRVPDLSFRVFARALHPDWFTVKEHRHVVQDGWDADVRVVEGGHVIHWRFDRIRLTEVLAGPDVILPEPGLLFHSGLRHERSATLRPGDGVEYQTTFEVERCDPEVFDHLCDEATLDATREGLFHSFASANRLAPPAVSLLRFESRTRRLSIHTFHSFPDERAIVRTHSLFESRLALPTL
jgi:hypothetical protein